MDGDIEVSTDDIAAQAPRFDYETYAHFLEDTDLSESQKHEALETLWNIIVQFVELGFGVHPVQQAQNACGKLSDNSPNPALAAPSVVNCKNSQSICENEESASGAARKASPV